MVSFKVLTTMLTRFQNLTTLLVTTVLHRAIFYKLWSPPLKSALKTKDPLAVLAFQAVDRLIPVEIKSNQKSRPKKKRQAPVDPLITAVEIGKKFLVRDATAKTSMNYNDKI